MFLPNSQTCLCTSRSFSSECFSLSFTLLYTYTHTYTPFTSTWQTCIPKTLQTAQWSCCCCVYIPLLGYNFSCGASSHPLLLLAPLNCAHFKSRTEWAGPRVDYWAATQPRLFTEFWFLLGGGWQWIMSSLSPRGNSLHFASYWSKVSCDPIWSGSCKRKWASPW